MNDFQYAQVSSQGERLKGEVRAFYMLFYEASRLNEQYSQVRNICEKFIKELEDYY